MCIYIELHLLEVIDVADGFELCGFGVDDVFHVVLIGEHFGAHVGFERGDDASGDATAGGGE